MNKTCTSRQSIALPEAQGSRRITNRTGMTNIRIKEWGEKWVERFNELSTKYEVPYYTQSPLNLLGDGIDKCLSALIPKEATKELQTAPWIIFLQVMNVGGKDFAEIRMCGSLRMVPDSLWAMMLLNM